MRLIFLVTFLLVICVCPAQSAELPASRSERINQTIATNVLKVMSGCSERLWQVYNWDHLTLLLVAEDPEKSLVVSVKEHKVQALSKLQVSPAAFNSAFSFFEFNGSRWMSINTALAVSEMAQKLDSEIAEDQFRLAIHEAFHDQVQSHWGRPQGLRGTELPILSEPRLIRSQIYLNLRDAFAKRAEGPSLTHARYWYERWTATYESEVKGTTDGYEGSAKYVELLAAGIAEQSCSVSDGELLESVVKLVSAEFGKVFETRAFSLDAEGYEIGALSLLLAKQQGLQLDWQKKVSKGENPVSLVTNKVPSAVEPINASTVAKFEARATDFQAQADLLVGKTLASLRRADHFIISVPQTWIAGSLSPLGFYVDRLSSTLLIPMAGELNFKDPNGSSELLASKGAVIVGHGYKSPCLHETPFNYVVAGTLEVDSHVFAASTDEFSASLGGTTKFANGVSWFCAGE